MPLQNKPIDSALGPKRAIVSAANLSKVYVRSNGVVRAVEDVTFDINPSEIIVVVGPSGCGKTTLLKLLANLSKPTSGSIIWNGISAPKSSFVFQKPLLLPWRTLEDNVLLAFDLRGNTSAKQRCERARSVLDALGLTEFRAVYPNQLSGGMAQRAALARALVDDPEIVFLDEPLSAVDELKRESLWVEFRRIWNQRNVAVLWVTHSVREAAFLADRILVMSPSPGRISHEICTELPVTRNLTTLFSQDFLALTKTIKDALQTGEAK